MSSCVFLRCQKWLDNFRMETLPGSKTSKREGTSGPVDPRKTNVNFGKADRSLYRTSSQADMVDHFKTGSTSNVASSQVSIFCEILKLLYIPVDQIQILVCLNFKHFRRKVPVKISWNLPLWWATIVTITSESPTTLLIIQNFLLSQNEKKKKKK